MRLKDIDILGGNKNSLTAQLFTLILGFVCLWVFFYLRFELAAVTLYLELSTKATTVAQIYIPVAESFSEESSQKLSVQADGERHIYPIRLARNDVLDRIRIDPANGPGEIALHSLKTMSLGQEIALQGESLYGAIDSLNDLRLVNSSDDAVEFLSIGDDPYLVIKFPHLVGDVYNLFEIAAWLSLFLGVVALVAASLFLCSFLLKAKSRMRPQWLIPIAAVSSLFLTMTFLGVGCDGGGCSIRGLRYGAQLMLAITALTIVGVAVLKAVHFYSNASSGLNLISASLVGLVSLNVYIYARSLLHAIFSSLPLTSLEIWVVVFGCGIYCWFAFSLSVEKFFSSRSKVNGWVWLFVRVAVLTVICVIVADRELPRLTMLSSDPDVHAFLATQLQRMGGVYWHQADWGPNPLGYPAGSAVMIFTWASLSLLDAGNTLAALPLLLTLLSGMAIGEAMVKSSHSILLRVVLMVAAVGVTTSGFLFPLYEKYAHVEGFGRQASIAYIALIFLIFIYRRDVALGERLRYEYKHVLIATLTLFALLALNPINLLLPSILIVSHAVVVLIWERRISLWLLVPLVCSMLLMMDPYYWGLISGRTSPATIVLVGQLTSMTFREIFEAWVQILLSADYSYLQSICRFLSDEKLPSFALIVAILSIGWISFGWKPKGDDVAFLMTLAIVFVCVSIVNTLMMAVANDSRLYLLPIYFPVSVAQFKFLLVLVLALGLISRVGVKRSAVHRSIFVFFLLVFVFGVILRSSNSMNFSPRHSYCGPIGCVQTTDIEIVEGVNAMIASRDIDRVNGYLPRVLVPNSFVENSLERWIFPVGGSRYFAVKAGLPVAFYYYQGDSIFTTVNYERHVCEELDRKWLLENRIHYVFLPSERSSGCLAGGDRLIETDEVLLKSGNSYFIRLNSISVHH